MTDNVAREIVDLVVDEKPNKAGDALNDELVDRVADKVQAVKDQVSNSLFGVDNEDAEQVEVQPELDLPDPEVEEDGEQYEAEQELIDEPDEAEELDVESEEDSTEDESPEDEDNEDENT